MRYVTSHSIAKAQYVPIEIDDLPTKLLAHDVTALRFALIQLTLFLNAAYSILILKNDLKSISADQQKRLTLNLQFYKKGDQHLYHFQEDKLFQVEKMLSGLRASGKY